MPSCTDRSRTTRGSLLHSVSIGCMRVFMTPSCSSPAIRLSRWVVRARSTSSRAAACCSIWLRVSTSSPTRFISESSSVTSTRIVLSATERRPSTGSPGSGAPPRRARRRARRLGARRGRARGRSVPRPGRPRAPGDVLLGQPAVLGPAMASSAPVAAGAGAPRRRGRGQPGDEVGVGPVALGAGVLDVGEQRADGVDDLEQQAGEPGGQGQLAVTQPSQQALADVGHRLQDRRRRGSRSCP